MTARSLIGAEIQILGTGQSEMPTEEIVDFDFGGAGDLHLPSQPGFTPGCRVIIIFTGRMPSSGTGSGEDIVFTVLDGEDNQGVIANVAPAEVDDGKWVGPPKHRALMYGLGMRAGRPWLRCQAWVPSEVTPGHGQAIVLAIPAHL